METIQKGKQTNKQTSRGSMCRGADAGGGVELHSMQSPVCNTSECHGMTSLPLLWPPLTPSASTLPLPPPLCSNSKACLHNLCNCIVPTLGLTVDQHQTHLDLVPTPRATIYIPFLHLSYLPDPFSLTIAGNYSFLV